MHNTQTWIHEEYLAIILYIKGGKQTTPSPFKNLEDEFLNMGIGDPCKKIKDYIEKMKQQVEWRKGDLNPQSDSYHGHLERIKRLESQIKLLAGYLVLGMCMGEK